MLFKLARWTHVRGTNGQIAIGGSFAAMNGSGAFFAFSLERLAVLVKPAVYDLDLTLSGRATKGELWTPFNDPKSALYSETKWRNYLPELLNVPGHTGIRVHALNEAYQSDGCVGIGNKQYDADTILDARPALEALCRVLVAEKAAGRSSQLEIVEAFA